MLLLDCSWVDAPCLLCLQGLDTLAVNDDFCWNFGISPGEIKANIDDTNSFYGAGRPDLPPVRPA